MAELVLGYDHVAITVEDIQRTTNFYRDVLGARQIGEYAPDDRILSRSFMIGAAALNVHQTGNGYWMGARQPIPGSADICFRWDGAIADAEALLMSKGIEIIEGPVARITSDGKSGRSVYFKDPDGNLIELMAAED